jgi:hypothetical protein
MTPDIIKAGMRAINTSSMILEVVTLFRMCGEEDTTRVPCLKRPIIFYLLP